MLENAVFIFSALQVVDSGKCFVFCVDLHKIKVFVFLLKAAEARKNICKIKSNKI